MSWPIRCPACRSFDFGYSSDRSGNVRRYVCKSCGGGWLATLKGMSSGSAMCEPKNMDSKNLEWVRILK